MTTPATPSDPKPAEDDRNLVRVDENYVAPSFEDRLHLFWKNNRQLIVVGCVVVLVFLVGKGAWELYQAKHESGIEQEYAAAGTSEKLKAFVTAHPSHVLGGLAHLRLADEAYTAGRYNEASIAYDKAATTLKSSSLAARAQLGGAIAKLQAGKAAEAETALKQLSRDPSQLKGIRAEATYHLASLAAEAGKADEVTRYSDQLMQLDPTSAWTQRALGLRANLRTSIEPAKNGVAPTGAEISLPTKK